MKDLGSLSDVIVFYAEFKKLESKMSKEMKDGRVDSLLNRRPPPDDEVG